MALDSQVVPVALSQGLDTKNDPKKIALGKQLVLQNASFKSPGQLSKRDGFSSLPQSILGGGSVASGIGISSFQNELVSLDGSSLYSYSPDVSAQVNRGGLVPATLSVSPVIRNTNQQTSPDFAYHAGTGLQCFVWVDSNNGSSQCNYSVIDSTTGAILVNDATVLGVATKAKVLTLGVYFVIVFYNSAGPDIQYRAINTATPTAIGSAIVLANDINSGEAFDATVINGSIYVAYGKSTNDVAFYSLSSSLVLSSQYVVTAGNTPKSCITIAGDASNNVWVAYNFGTTVYALIVNSVLTTTLLAATEVDSSSNCYNITMIVSGTTATLYYQMAKVDFNSFFIRKNTLTFAGSVGTPSTLIYSMGLASKVFSYNGVNYLLALYCGQNVVSASNLIGNSIEPTYFLINGSGKVILKVAPLSGGNFNVTGFLPQISSVGSTRFAVPYLFQDDLSSTGGAIFYNTGVMLANINFQLTNAMPKLVIGQNLHFGSGQLWMYDGANVVEQGFHIFPENLLSSVTASGGGIGASLNNNASGPNQVQYVALYEWVDNQGQIHRSNPSSPLTVPLPTGLVSAITFTGDTSVSTNVITSVSSFTGLAVGQVITDTTNAGSFPAGTYITSLTPGSSELTTSQPATASNNTDHFKTLDVMQIQITIPALSATLKTNVSVVLYRTENNQTIFYRVTSPNSTTVGATFNGFTYNSTTTDTVVINDALPDSQIVGNEELYTTGGTLGNINAPAISASCTYMNRMMYLSPENPFSVGYSQQVIPPAAGAAGTPVSFNSLEFNINVDQRIGQCTAIAPMDTEFVIFGPSKKFWMSGTGPSSNGTQNSFTNPTPIAGVSGCSNPVSVLEIPSGLIYQDSQKGFWLLSRALQESYIGADVEQYNSQTVTSANLFPNSTKCMFTLSNGVNLIYDYYVQQWETDIFPSAAIDSTVFENDLVYIQANGLINQQTPGTYMDENALVPLSFTTGWMNFAGISGFQRVWELQIEETFYSPHVLTVNVYTDFSETPTTTKVITVNSPPIPSIFRIHLEVQKCTSIQVQIIESQPTQTSGTYGQGLSINSLAFKVGQKKGPYKLPAGNSY